MAIKIHIVKRKNGNYMLRWFDPVSGRLLQKTTSAATRSEAEPLAVELADKLSRGVNGEVTWRDFVERFKAERMPMVAPGTRETYAATFKMFERYVAHIRMCDINGSVLSGFAASLRTSRKEVTVAKHLRQLRTALQWAFDLEMIPKIPSLPKAARGTIIKHMKGRPLSDEEFQRFLTAITERVRPQDVAAWQFFARGMWFQGLRLSEAVGLSWDREDRHRVDLTAKPPKIWIRGHLEKGKKDREHPMAPEFAVMLQQVPESERKGDVFKLPLRDPHSVRPYLSRVGCQFGKQAGILVAKDPQTGKEKYASFHDLRRSCGLRWASRMIPQLLMNFMRHESYETTKTYYTGQQCQQTAEVMWAAYNQANGLVPHGETGQNNPANVPENAIEL